VSPASTGSPTETVSPTGKDRVTGRSAEVPTQIKRADAARNQETLLAAAAAMFVSSGVDAPIREIAGPQPPSVRAGQPCPVCGDTVRKVSFADSALQYCPTCQTGGKPLADRRTSRPLK